MARSNIALRSRRINCRRGVRWRARAEHWRRKLDSVPREIKKFLCVMEARVAPGLRCPSRSAAMQFDVASGVQRQCDCRRRLRSLPGILFEDGKERTETTKGTKYHEGITSYELPRVLPVFPSFGERSQRAPPRKLVGENRIRDAIIFVRPTSQIPHRGRVAQLAEQLTLNQ